MSLRTHTLVRAFLFALPLALATFRASAVSQAAEAAPRFAVFSRAAAATASPARPSAQTSDAAPGQTLRIDAGAVQGLRAEHRARVILPLADGNAVELTLTRFDLLSAGAVVTATGDAGPIAIRPDVTLYRGGIDGEPGSWAVLGFSSHEVLGVVETRSARYVLGPVRGAAPGGRPEPGLHLISNVRDLPPHAGGFVCDPARLAEATREDRLPVPRNLSPEITPTRLQCRVAIDCDYEFYADKFASNLGNATNYVVTLMGVVSAVYERDLNVTLTVPYLNLWTTSSDPYTQSTTTNQLPEFRSYWNAHRGSVQRDIAHLISGRSLGGGIAYLTALCNLSNAYAVSALDASYRYPTNTATWDAVVMAHEIGHNFSSEHTHSCFWQANGYAPPGALLDSCYAAEGSCYSGPTGLVPSDGKGTIMSYCHQVAGVAGGIRLAFHPACESVMRQHAEACLDPSPLQPARSPTASVTNWVVNLAWTASPSPGVVRYDVHRSAFSADPSPLLIGSTAGTSYADDNRFGTLYYKVQAATNTDVTPYTSEVEVEVCAPIALGPSSAGAEARAPVVGDFNEDGIADLAVANQTLSGTVSVLIGHGSGGVGDGTFAAPLTYACGTMPASLVSADFNDDGISDLVVVNDATPGTYSILFGQGSGGVGDGTFGAAVTGSVGDRPAAVLAADFDEDGVLDLAIANLGSNTVSILRGLGSNGVGTGAFADPVDIPVRALPLAVATGDFNQDGILDLAVVCRGSGAVSILLGQGANGIGNGGFAPAVSYPVGGVAVALTTGDFDEDGITDLAVVRQVAAGRVVVLRGQGLGGVGNGTFASGVSIPCGPSPSSVFACDLNGNGVTDLLISNGNGAATVTALLGRGAGGIGDGSFEAPQSLPVGGDVEGLALGDFDEDDTPDLAITVAGGSLGVFLGRCPAATASEVALLEPNGGEQWPVGTEQVISWTKGPAVPSVTIELSRDNGLNWEAIATGQTGASFTWTVTPPQAASATALVRIYDPRVPGRSDASDAAFQIASPTVGVPAPTPVELALRGVFPNPARGRLTVSFSLPGPGFASLELIDIAGRRIASREVGLLGSGSHAVDLGPRPSPPGGVYLLRLTRGGEQVTRKVVVVK